MGAGLSNSLKPEELHEFRKLNPERTALTVNIPARPEDRSATDKKFLIVFIATIILLLPFLIYCWSYSDIRRITTWTDTCGNFCGYKNKQVDGIECSGNDFTNQPMLQFSQPVNFTLKRWYLYDRKCVSSCDDFYKADHNLRICYPSWEVSDVSKNYFFIKFIQNLSLTETQVEWWKFIFTILIGISLTLTFMCLLRYIPTIVVWTCLMLNISLFAGGAIALWYYYATSKDIIPEEQKTYKDTAITFTALAILLVMLLSSVFKRIRLVVLLMKETTKAIFNMPLLLTVPMLTFIIQLIAVAVLGVNFVFLLSYGTLTEISKTGFYVYDQDPLWIFTMFYNAFVTVCILDFIGGCHFIIIAGAVSSWYFAKNNRYLQSPIWNSAKLLFRFHLGTVALGSLVITLIKMIRILIASYRNL